MTPWAALYPPTVSIRPATDPQHMLHAWDRTVAAYQDRPGVHYFDATFTFSELDRQADALAAAMRDRGLAPGDRVGIYLQNDPQWLVSMIATWKLGATAVALNPMLRTEELRHHLEDSQPKVLICEEGLFRQNVVSLVGGDSGLFVITTSPLDMIGAAEAPQALTSAVAAAPADVRATSWRSLLPGYRSAAPAPVPFDPGVPALLTYTSGTTGRAKGAMNTHDAVRYNAQVYAEWFDLRSGDPVLGIAPFSHITGSVACLAVGIVTGAPMIMLHRFDAAEVLRLVEKWRPAFTVAASTAYLALANHPSAASRDLSSVTKAASGGAPVTAALVQDVRRRLGWELNGVYGLTETTSPTHLTPPGATVPVDPETGALAVGIPVPGVRVRLLDLDSGLDCAAGEAGEIAVRGPMVIAGYWNAPAESAHAIRDGWLYTGDVGVMNELGWLWVVDRKKDLINASGFKVWPGEVEEVLAGHPAVLESVVVGVPDPYRGETVKAFVVLRDGMTAEPAALVAFCRDRLAAYKYPRLVEFVEILPKTASGKVLRRTLRDKPAQ